MSELESELTERLEGLVRSLEADSPMWPSVAAEQTTETLRKLIREEVRIALQDRDREENET
jgi:hypothetical protein